MNPFCLRCSSKNNLIQLIKEVVYENKIHEEFDLTGVTRILVCRRKFPIQAYVCSTCLEKQMMKDKRSLLIWGILSLFAFLILLYFKLFTNVMSETSFTLIIIIFGFFTLGSFFFYFESKLKRKKSFGESILENEKDKILSDRTKEKLCEVCGEKGSHIVEISLKEKMILFPSLTYRCNLHEPKKSELLNRGLEINYKKI